MAAKGRQMTIALTLSLFMIALGVVLSWMVVARNGDCEFFVLWVPPTVFADAIPIAIGGIVRTLRSAATTRPSAA